MSKTATTKSTTKPMKGAKGLVFATVRTEGALLPVDLLTRIVSYDSALGGLSAESYGLASSEKLSDAILQSWNRLLGIWRSFAKRLEELSASETSAETQTRKEWLLPLFQELGYGRLTVADPVEIGGVSYPVKFRSNDIAIELVGARVDLDKRPVSLAQGFVPRAPHSMVQEFLNRSEAHLWAVVTNGLRLRLLRDNSSLTRQAYCEFDLEAMFSGQEYAEFALMWLTCHASRLEGTPQSECWLEKWSKTALDDGVRALDALRAGVERAIEELGTGFLIPANAELRAKLRSGEVSTVDYQRQMLRVIYRLLFLLVAESRGALLDPNASSVAVERYKRFYSVQRLVGLARKQKGSMHTDLWDGLCVVFRALDRDGAAQLGISPLGSSLWSAEFVDAIDGCRLPNRALLAAIDSLTTFETNGTRRWVDYRNLGSEELGSVYEALLEMHAELNLDEQRFVLATAAGNDRKTTGSYYTPTSLIKVLLDSALDPVLDEAACSEDPEAALLDLKVIDPAVGSGHFLIAASHRIAHRLASVRSGETEPSPDELRKALRDVIGRCVYGVDINPMSVELCKVSLWMEALEPGRPLSFLDHRIKCGNTLLGTTPALIAQGVPDDAFKKLTGDEGEIVNELKRVNKKERDAKGQGTLDFGATIAADARELAAGLGAIDRTGDDDVAAIAVKAKQFAELQESDAAARLKLAADAWCGAFVAPKSYPDPTTKLVRYPSITTSTVRALAANPEMVPGSVRNAVEGLAGEYQFFHLHVEFPDVFTVPEDLDDAENPDTGWSGGFDVVLGNPPWERVKLQEKEWFATRAPEIAAASNAAARKRMIKALETENPALFAQFQAALRHAEGESMMLRTSGRFPLAGRGDVNTYAVFAELMRTSVSPTGRVGVIVPTGIATDDTTKFFFADLVDRGSLVSLFDFENREKVFPGIDSRIKFALLTLSGLGRPIDEAEFVFFALNTTDLDDPEKRFTLSPDDFALLNPNTRTCPVFRTRRDAEITKGIYQRVPVLVKEGDPDGNPWGVEFSTMFHMSNDSHLFRTREELENQGFTLAGNHFVKDDERYLPLYEGRLGHQFSHRFAEQHGGDVHGLTDDDRMDPTRIVETQYWVAHSDFEKASKAQVCAWLGFRRVARNNDERTVIAALIPYGPASYGWILTLGVSPAAASGLCALYNSFVFDYTARGSLSQPSMPQGTFAQLPAIGPDLLVRVAHGLEKRVLELTYTAWDMAPFAQHLGYDGPPFKWDADRRALLRAELDALMFRLYGIERDDVDYIMETFPIVKRKDEAEFGEYRTKRLILERYDAMAEADAAGREYETILDPPPADPRCAHPESTRPDWAV